MNENKRIGIKVKNIEDSIKKEMEEHYHILTYPDHFITDMKTNLSKPLETLTNGLANVFRSAKKYNANYLLIGHPRNTRDDSPVYLKLNCIPMGLEGQYDFEIVSNNGNKLQFKPTYRYNQGLIDKIEPNGEETFLIKENDLAESMNYSLILQKINSGTFKIFSANKDINKLPKQGTEKYKKYITAIGDIIKENHYVWG